jgi:hypothetical protein
MKKLGCAALSGPLLLAIAPALAQTAPALRGPYHYVRMQVREEAAGKLTVRSGGGTILFDEKGGFTMKGRMGANREAARAIDRSGTYSMGPDARVTLVGLWDAKESIELRTGNPGAMMAGAANAGSKVHDIVVAVPAPAAGAPQPSLSGTFAGGYMLVLNGEPSGVTTGFAEMKSGGGGKFAEVFAISHSASVDDVNRREEMKDAPYSMAADGTGSATFANMDDAGLSGETSLLLSQDGQTLLGYPAGAGRRSVMVLVKKPAEQVTWMFNGPYWAAEIGAESPFKFQPSALRFASGTGALRAGGEGLAAIREQMNTGGRSFRLITMNQYRIGTDGASAFGPRVSNTQRSFAITEGGAAFSGAEVGALGELTLQHGIVVGMRAPGAVRAGAFPGISRGIAGPGVPMHSDWKPANSGQPAKPGEAVQLLVAGIGPVKAGGTVRVWFGGKAGQVTSAVCVADLIDLWWIQVAVPQDAPNGDAVPVVVEAPEAMVDLADVAIRK